MSAARVSGQLRRGPKVKPVVDRPKPLFEVRADPKSFSEALALQMRRHEDSCWHLQKAVVGKREHFDRRTLQSWLSGRCLPRTALSMMVLARIERRYRLPAGYFKDRLPHPTRPASAHRYTGMSAAERRRFAWHLPDDFSSRDRAEQAEILNWVRTTMLGGSTAYRRFQAEAMKHAYSLSFQVAYNDCVSGGGQVRTPRVQAAPSDLQEEMQRFVQFKTATLTPIGLRRNGVWCAETADQRVEHLSLLFGALSADPDGPAAGFGVSTTSLTFALLAFPPIWDWYLNWRFQRRGFFTCWEVDMLRLGMALCRSGTGWLRQSPELTNRLKPIPSLLSSEDIEGAREDWDGTCDQLWSYAALRAKEVASVARTHRDPFEAILPILEASSPVKEYRIITEEIARRIPDREVYPRSAAEAVRAFLMLRIGLHLGVRQRNLRELLVCAPGCQPRTERELETLRRGELALVDGKWRAFIPNTAFKNAHSSFFSRQPLRLELPDLGGLYGYLREYVGVHRRILLNGSADPGTLFIKTVKRSSRKASYDKNTFYEAWSLAIQRYGIWNPYTKRGAVAGLLPHGPHSVRDVLATHVLKQTGSYEQASYAIQDTPETVAKHYGRFLPQDKASMAAAILNQAWL